MHIYYLMKANNFNDNNIIINYMKILFYGTYPNTTSGYSRIANIITNYLSEKNNEIYYISISNFNNNNICDRFIHPNINLIDDYLMII